VAAPNIVAVAARRWSRYPPKRPACSNEQAPSLRRRHPRPARHDHLPAERAACDNDQLTTNISAGLEVSMFSGLRARRRTLRFAAAMALVASTFAVTAAQSARPMTFLDMRQMRNIGSPTPSPDGRWLLYTLSTPDWKEAKSQTDLYIVSVQQGVSSTKQMTFTKEKNESSPRWARDGRAFFFLSNREAPENAASRNQLYVMRPDGGEAQRLTDAREGVRDYQISKDGRWLVYRSGKDGEEQLYRLPTAGIETASAEQLTKHATGVGSWQWAPDDKRIYFVSPDSIDKDERDRREKRFTVNIRNMETPSASLWALDLDANGTTKLTDGAAYAATQFTISNDGKWIGFRGQSLNRYERGITAESLYADVYLLETATGQIERLTNNREVSESGLSFSPDSQMIAFSTSDDTTGYNMSNGRVHVRGVAERGKPFRKIGTSFDGDVSVGFWSKDGSTIYFNEGIRATNQLMMLDVKSGAVRQVTEEKGSLSVDVDDDSGVVLIQYSDPKTPSTIFTADTVQNVSSRGAWRQLTDANPQVKGFLLGEEEEITWKSKDGTTVGGILVKPVGYKPGQRYPLIVAIHGGPAAADVLGFNGGYGAQVYAGAGYAVLKPNYRGSTNYGLKHKTDIVGNYFQAGYEDIMTGVDHLIALGVVDGDKMGVLGWSAGGHWSNWILTHTDRFKAISSGAGTSNWISMYAQSDVQRNRQFYLGNKLPYDDYDAYWNQSPLKYIKNAKTPTMIHVVEGDPRVPSPQSVELHMALKQLGVPTELYMYPGNTHGIPDPRNQLVKSVSEMAWMDHYVRGIGKKFSWRDVLKTLEDPAAPVKTTTEQRQD
jgi:dipeptidyl aminopeptidase/acylaminoacyl peptidase